VVQTKEGNVMDVLTRGILEEEQPTFAKSASVLMALTDFGGEEGIEKTAYGAPWDSQGFGPPGAGITRWAESYKWNPKQKVKAITLAQKWLDLKVKKEKLCAQNNGLSRPRPGWDSQMDKIREKQRNIEAEGWKLEREALNDEMKRAKEDAKHDSRMKLKRAYGAPWDGDVGPSGGGIARWADNYKWSPKQKVKAIEIAQKWLDLKVKREKMHAKDRGGRMTPAWDKAMDKIRVEQSRLEAEGWKLEKAFLEDEKKRAKEDAKRGKSNRPSVAKTAAPRWVAPAVGAAAVKGEEINEKDLMRLQAARKQKESPGKATAVGATLGALAGAGAGAGYSRAVKKIRKAFPKKPKVKKASTRLATKALSGTLVKGIRRLFGKKVPRSFTRVGVVSGRGGAKRAVHVRPSLQMKGVPAQLGLTGLHKQYGKLGVHVGKRGTVRMERRLAREKLPAHGRELGPKGTKPPVEEATGLLGGGGKGLWESAKGVAKRHPLLTGLGLVVGAPWAYRKLTGDDEQPQQYYG
jgi:hypothetical protein